MWGEDQKGEWNFGPWLTMDTLLDDIDCGDIGDNDSASDTMEYFQNHLFQIFDQWSMLSFLLRKSAILYWKSGEAKKEKV